VSDLQAAVRYTPVVGNSNEMTGNPPDRKAVQELPTAHPEVEFALVLARTIESIKTDPEQLRGAVYELARQKLREQFSHEDAAQVPQLTAALEVAIQSVELHARKDAARQSLTFNPSSAPRAITDGRYPSEVEVLEPIYTDPDDGSAPALPPRWITDPEEKSSGKRVSFSAPLRFMLVIGVVLFAALLFMQRTGELNRFREAPSLEAARQTPVPAKVDPRPVAAEPEPPKMTRLLPTSFGIYAIDGEKLYELEPLQGRAPDIRVAVSAVILTPSKTVLPDGNIKFIVFRRDSGNSAPDQADVRVVAKIDQATTFDAAGKPVVGKAEENWVIRNISFPYRTAPEKENPEMYEVQSKDPEFALTPGRYALVVKGQAYDFTVAGTVTDDRQCLARLAAANGTFYSACQKPPDAKP
jgi:hypothetical protein